MCETTIRIKENDQVKDVVKAVLKLKVTKDGLLCYDALGEETVLEGVEIVEANFIHPHELIVRRTSGNS